jgi:hypothetical protein
LNGPDSSVDESLTVEESFEVSTVSGETNILRTAGADVDSANAFFLLRWSEGPRHVQSSDELKGHASAVAFETITTPRDFNAVGLDMGTVAVLNGQNQYDLAKIVRGVADVRYGVFGGLKGRHAPHGGKGGPGGGPHVGPRSGLKGDSLTIINIPFVGGSNYQFNVTGAGNIAAMTLDIQAPSQWMQITGLADKDSIDATRDLTVSWSGDASANNMVLVLAPAKGRGHFGGGPGQAVSPIFQRVEAAAGSYTVSAQTLQELVSQSEAKALSVHLSQGRYREINDANVGKIIVNAGTDDHVILIVK